MEKFQISNLVCNQVNHLNKCFNISKKISKNLIRVAATRIFADPTRSFLELPLNSIDAYKKKRGERSEIGKFGIGFFSVLYWLIDHPKRSITITSITKKEAFVATIREEEQDLMVEIEPISLREGPGFKVEFDFLSDNVGPDLLDMNLVRYLASLYHVKNLGLVFRQQEVKKFDLNMLNSIKDWYKYVIGNEINEELEPEDNVYEVDPTLDYIEITSILKGDKTQYLSFEDFATGISYDNFINVLMVPSVSTKTIALSVFNPNEIKSVIEDYNDNVLEIVINDVVISKVDVYIDEYQGIKVIIYMPKGTPIPVSRDNIIFKPEVLDIFVKTVDNLLNTMLANMEQRFYVNNLLILLQKYVDTYGKEQPQLEKAVNKIINNKLISPKVLPVHPSIDRLIQIQLQKLTKRSIFASNLISAFEAEANIKSEFRFDNNIFVGKSVLFLSPSPEEKLEIVSSGNFPSLLFIDVEYKDRIKEIASSYLGEILVPIGNQILSDKLDVEFESHTYSVKYDYDLNKYLSLSQKLYLAYLGAKSNYQIFPNFAGILYDCLVFSTFMEVKQILLLFQYHFSKLRPNVQYGERPVYYLSIIPTEVIIRSKNRFGRQLSPYEEKYANKIIEWGIDLGNKGPIIRFPNIQPDYFSIFDKGLYVLSFLDNHLMTGGQLIVFFSVINASNLDISLDLLQFLYSEIKVKYSDNQLQKIFLHTMSAVYDIVFYPLIVGLRVFVSGQMTKLINLKRILNLPIQYSFSCNGLIQYSFNHDIIPGQRSTSFSERKRREGKLDLQLVDIAVNAGTEKNILSSILTELLQNSIDARRQLFGERQLIEINIGDFEQDSSSLSKLQGRKGLQIVDYVGISDQGLLSILIPFLSTKDTKNTNVTGENGTGFFNNYRQPLIHSVIIETENGVRSNQIVATPILSDNRVVDIKYQTSVGPSKNLYKTSIIVLFNKLSLDWSKLIVEFTIFVRNKLAILENLRVNGQKIEKDKRLLYQENGVTVYSVKEITSQLYTNGVPFSDLGTYIEQNLKEISALVPLFQCDLCIDIDKSLYTGTQGRTSINTDKKHITKALHQSLAKLILEEKVESQVIDELIPFYSVKADFSQCLFSQEDKGYSIFSFIKFDGNFSLNFYIKLIWGKLYGLKFTSKDNYLDTLKKSIASILAKIPDEYRRLIYNWFEHKSPAIITTTDVKSENKRKLEEIARLQEYLNSFVSVLYNILRKSNVKGLSFEKEPKIVIKESIKGANGFYSKSEHTIYLQYTDNLPLLLEGLDQKIDVSLWRTDKHFREIIPRIPCSTLIHEIGHAWRESNHTGEGVHDKKRISIDGIEETYSFDEGIQKVYSHAIANGFYTKFVRSIL